MKPLPGNVSTIVFLENNYFPNLKNLVWESPLVFVFVDPLMLGWILLSDCAFILLQMWRFVYEETWPHTNVCIWKGVF